MRQQQRGSRRQRNRQKRGSRGEVATESGGGVCERSQREEDVAGVAVDARVIGFPREDSS